MVAWVCACVLTLMVVTLLHPPVLGQADGDHLDARIVLQLATDDSSSSIDAKQQATDRQHSVLPHHRQHPAAAVVRTAKQSSVTNRATQKIPATPWWLQPQDEETTAILAATIPFPSASNRLMLTASTCLQQVFGNGKAAERHVFSQWGEDGILEAVFRCIGTTTKTYVEFGVEDGKECSTRWLREAHGFTGLLMDGSNDIPEIGLHKEMMYASNIDELFQKYKVPFPTMDHMTIDIDQNTWYVAAAVLAAGWKPRSLIIEFNRNFLPHQSYVVEHHPQLMWSIKYDCFFGGSALATTRLAEQYGYHLVSVDQLGVNLFFVHESALGSSPSAQVHAATPVKHHPLHQVWPKLHRECQQQKWIEVPANVSFRDWDPQTAHRVVLKYQHHSTFRVFYSWQPSLDSIFGAPQLEAAEKEFARYSGATHTMHPEYAIDQHGNQLRQHRGKLISMLSTQKAPDPRAPIHYSNKGWYANIFGSLRLQPTDNLPSAARRPSM